ncbi:hypothetical protein Tco_1054972 [Tanacetum coccineum]|uniref:FHA domain-containing protein n=1 Tax=Tanacetum coccineum TaxID=301880 RepID=A0ABQ5GYA8_9ASTR
MKWRSGNGGCNDDVDSGVGAAVTAGGEGGDGVGLVAAREGACWWGSDRSVGEKHFGLGRKTRRKTFSAAVAGIRQWLPERVRENEIEIEWGHFEKQYPQNKVQQMGGARERAYAIDGGICLGTLFDPSWSELELYLSGDKFLRCDLNDWGVCSAIFRASKSLSALVLSVVGIKGCRVLVWGDKEVTMQYLVAKVVMEVLRRLLGDMVVKSSRCGSIRSNSAHVNKATSFYDDTHKQALGYQNLFYLKKAQRIKPTLYDGSVISSQHAAILVINDEETLILEEVSRSKMLAKQNDPMSKEKKVNTTQINYVELNRLSEDFGKRFVSQQELSDEEAFWLQTSHPNTNKSASSPVKIEAPKELPKVSLVNTSLKKLKYHLGQFDIVVKKQITPDAMTEGEWGFEHSKAVFLKEIIPFLKTFTDIFNVFDKDLLNEVTEVQTVFNQMEAVVQQYVMICVMNSTVVFDDVNLEMQSSEFCVKCLDLDAELLNKQNADNQNAIEIPEYFEYNDLKAQLQATICKLKEHIKSMRENDKEENVKYDMDEIETINIELEHSVAKLLSENECLHKEIEHLKKIYKDQFDSIKKTRSLSKE